MENQQPAGEAQNSQKKEWYKNWWGVIIAIMILPFFAIWYIWAKTQWSNKAKWITTVLIIIFSMGAIGSTEQDNNQSQPTVSTPVAVQEAKNETPAIQQPEKKTIPYEVILEWSIPNGGKGERIVIDSKYLNFDDMTALGETLKEAMKNERNAFVYIHTDKKSADLQGKLSVNPTTAELDYIGKHYVGTYSKNANSKFHEFEIFFGGIDDTSEATNKIITY
jgi:hypothetical protein